MPNPKGPQLPNGKDETRDMTVCTDNNPYDRRADGSGYLDHGRGHGDFGDFDDYWGEDLDPEYVEKTAELFD